MRIGRGLCCKVLTLRSLREPNPRRPRVPELGLVHAEAAEIAEEGRCCVGEGIFHMAIGKAACSSNHLFKL